MIEFEPNSKFSNVISIKEMERWKGNVILDGGTGSGKTTLILNKFARLHKNKSILYLVNRKRLHEDIENKTEHLKNVTVKTYQWLDTCIEKGIDIKQYDFIVCDEFHYVFEDSTFNDLTGNSYEYILNNNAPKIFMSATAKQIFNFFKHEKIVDERFHYYIPKSYDYVNNFVFYSKKKHLKLILESILENTNDKVVLFVHSLDLGIEIYNSFKHDSILYCSDNARDMEAIRIRNNTLYKLDNETFNCRLLITTSALDNGINLIDRDIKHIICTMWQENQIEQCIGRKRIIDSNDTCTFYFYNRNVGMFNSMKRYKYDSLYPLTVRKMKACIDNVQLDHLTGYDTPNGYREPYTFKYYIVNEFDFDWNKVIDYKDILKEYETMCIDVYLESIVGKKLYKKEQSELINMIDLRVNGRLQRSLSKLNDGLRMLNLPYIIIKNIDKRRKLEDGTENINRDKTYWELVKSLG